MTQTITQLVYRVIDAGTARGKADGPWTERCTLDTDDPALALNELFKLFSARARYEIRRFPVVHAEITKQSEYGVHGTVALGKGNVIYRVGIAVSERKVAIP